MLAVKQRTEDARPALKDRPLVARPRAAGERVRGLAVRLEDELQIGPRPLLGGSGGRERSSRTTFPTLANFRLGRIHGYRRIFAHPAAIFVERGIADLPSLQIASLSAEPCEVAAEATPLPMGAGSASSASLSS